MTWVRGAVGRESGRSPCLFNPTKSKCIQQTECEQQQPSTSTYFRKYNDWTAARKGNETNKEDHVNRGLYTVDGSLHTRKDLPLVKGNVIKPPTKTKAQQKQHDIQDKVL